MMELLPRALMERLTRKGVEAPFVPALLRNLVNMMSAYPAADRNEIGRRLESLGWDNLELDECTFELILATLELSCCQNQSSCPIHRAWPHILIWETKDKLRLTRQERRHELWTHKRTHCPNVEREMFSAHTIASAMTSAAKAVRQELAAG